MSDRLKIREERITLLIERGFTGDIKTGIVYTPNGIIINSEKMGYLRINFKIDKHNYDLKQHQFIYYLATGEVVDNIDHINGIKTDNRIENLRPVTHQQNMFNTKASGYSWHKTLKKWRVRIMINGKEILLGYFPLEEEHLARQCYLDAKLKYHII